MIFNNKNTIELKEYTISGQFEDDRFTTAEYGQELYMLSTLHEKTEIKLTADSNISFALDFRHTDGHDGRFPILVQMRDWWGLNPRKSQVYLITQRPGCTSSKIQGREWNGKQRYIIFCEDWRPGQWWVFNDYSYVGWKAGTVLNFDFTKPHASANASECPTSILQIDQELENYQKEEYLETKINQ